MWLSPPVLRALRVPAAALWALAGGLRGELAVAIPIESIHHKPPERKPPSKKVPHIFRPNGPNIWEWRRIRPCRLCGLSWSGAVPGVRRLAAAFQNACDKAEHHRRPNSVRHPPIRTLAADRSLTTAHCRSLSPAPSPLPPAARHLRRTSGALFFPPRERPAPGLLLRLTKAVRGGIIRREFSRLRAREPGSLRGRRDRQAKTKNPCVETTRPRQTDRAGHPPHPRA